MAKKILIVDDSLMMRSVIKNYLIKDGFDAEIIEAGNGKEAVQKYEAEHPDLIFMDIMMPEMDGRQASKIIKEKDPLAKIVICSSVDEDAINQEMADIGVNDRVTKPFKAEEIIPVVKKYLQ